MIFLSHCYLPRWITAMFSSAAFNGQRCHFLLLLYDLQNGHYRPTPRVAFSSYYWDLGMVDEYKNAITTKISISIVLVFIIYLSIKKKLFSSVNILYFLYWPYTYCISNFNFIKTKMTFLSFILHVEILTKYILKKNLFFKKLQLKVFFFLNLLISTVIVKAITISNTYKKRNNNDIMKYKLIFQWSLYRIKKNILKKISIEITR